MQRMIRQCDPWSHAINMLKFPTGLPSKSDSLTKIQRSLRTLLGQAGVRQPNRVVKVIDMPTSTTVTIAWFDSTSCRYGDQRWMLRIARNEGICALTGKPVRKGDHVYQPRKSGLRPLNANEMILSSDIGFTKVNDCETVGIANEYSGR